MGDVWHPSPNPIPPPPPSWLGLTRKTLNYSVRSPGTQTLYIFGKQFHLKNARKLRFHVFLHFHSRKHISQFYLRWTKLSACVPGDLFHANECFNWKWEMSKIFRVEFSAKKIHPTLKYIFVYVLLVNKVISK